MDSIDVPVKYFTIESEGSTNTGPGKYKKVINIFLGAPWCVKNMSHTEKMPNGIGSF